MHSMAANKRCLAINTPPIFNTPGNVAGIAIGSRPKDGPGCGADGEGGADADDEAVQESFVLRSGLNSACWQNTASAALIAIRLPAAATKNGSPASALRK